MTSFFRNGEQKIDRSNDRREIKHREKKAREREKEREQLSNREKRQIKRVREEEPVREPMKIK